MAFSLIAAIASLLVLVVLHELGHFFFAKKFGVKVEEFGIGIPPRLFGVRFGETLYSLNMLPLGAFVRMEGEEKKSESPRSFSAKPIWQRLLIVIGGIAAFWVIAAIILGTLAGTTGIQAVVPDEEQVSGAWVQIQGVASGSPARNAGIQAGDQIIALRAGADALEGIEKVGAIQEFTDEHAGKEVEVEVKRGTEVLFLTLIPRENPPAGEGAMGIALARIGMIQYSWYEAPLQGILMTAQTTWRIMEFLASFAGSLLFGKDAPVEAGDVRGPIGIVSLMENTFAAGNIAQFFSFVAVISIHLAIFNALPIPALDGGRAFFLTLEWLRRKPLPEALEQRMIAGSMLLLISLLIWVSIQDLTR